MKLSFCTSQANFFFLKFLSLLRQPLHSKNTSEPSIVQLLEKLPPTKPHWKSHNDTTAFKRTQKPLIHNISPPHLRPIYKSDTLPRPLDQLQSLRDLPSLCATAMGQPFLRMKKPQARALSRMVGRKERLFSERIANVTDVDEYLVPEAALEDEWDDMVRRLQQQQKQPTDPVDRDLDATYSWAAQLSRLWYQWRVEQTWQDWLARGEALHELVEAERAIILRKQPEQGKDQKAPAHISKEDPFESMAKERRGSKPSREQQSRRKRNVRVVEGEKLPIMYKSSTYQANNADHKDPFAATAWNAIVQAERPRLVRWARAGLMGKQIR